jgi:hypothetical protein
MLGLGLLVAMSSCSTEDKLKGYAEDFADLEVERKELIVEILDLKIEIYEDLESMGDTEFTKAYEKMQALNFD